MNNRRPAMDAAMWLGRWLVATAAVWAAWVVVTLAQGGSFRLDDMPCRGPDANLPLTAAKSAAIALPLAAAWSTARGLAATDEARRELAHNLIVILALLAAGVVLYLTAATMGCMGSMVLSNVGNSIPPSP